MEADVIIYAGEASAERVGGKDVAVVDVFRATSVMVEALHNGAKAVIPVETVEKALEFSDKYNRADVILGGERDTVLIEGFDKDNSPLAYTRADVEGKTIIFTTTNGTRAVLNSMAAQNIYIGAFLNVSAVCSRLAAGGRDVAIVCSGREDRFTAEDGLCAGAMAGILAWQYGYGLTDMAEVMRDMYDAAKDDLRTRLSTTLHYSDIMGRGYENDIRFCLQRDVYDIVPYYSAKGEIII